MTINTYAATTTAEHFAAAIGNRSSCGGNTSSSLSSQSRRIFLHSRLALTQNVCVCDYSILKEEKGVCSYAPAMLLRSSTPL
jgi:hypothetical protein